MADAPKKGRLTLYEDLLSAETIAEMKAKDAAVQAEEAKKKSNASLMFKPTNLGKKNTATKNQTTKPKPTFASMHKFSSSPSTSTVISAPPTTNPAASSPERQSQQLSSTPVQAPSEQQGKGAHKRGFNDWLADEDEEWQYYDQPKHNRGGRKKKKNKKQEAQEQAWSWEDIYDPTEPVMFLHYPKSEVQYDINDAWKQRLYDARKKEMQRQGKDTKRRYEDEDTSSNNRPPGFLNFAPPPDYSSDNVSRPRSPRRSSPYRSSDMAGLNRRFAEQHVDQTGDEAFAGRLALSSTNQSQEPNVKAPTPPVPSNTSAPPAAGDAAEKAARAAAQIAAIKAKVAAMKPTKSASPPVPATPSMQSPDPINLSVPPPPPPAQTEQPPTISTPSGSAGVISAAPTFNPEYFAQAARQDAAGAEDSGEAQQDQDLNAPRSLRPGQAGFAERMLKKMGWEKGQGLGASGDGITTAIIAKAEKRKKLPDHAGGGFAVPANMGKIVGGKKKAPKATEEESVSGDATFGKMSEVIKLGGMLKSLDVDHEIQENNLLQEIGDEMGQFGTVERLFIWRENIGGSNDVFIKFTSQLSGLRAVRAMDGEEFADNKIEARFWDAEKFEKEEYA